MTGEFDSLREKLAWRVFIGKLKATEWVSYIQPPPQQANNEPSSAESVMKYLARYLTGGPISDHRLISAAARSVTFWAREGTTSGGDSKQIPVTLSRLEFTRRWCLHILPAGFTKSRTFGGWHNRSREGYLERCAIMMEASMYACGMTRQNSRQAHSPTRKRKHLSQPTYPAHAVEESYV